ncbi:TKL/DRK protein kinase, variant [Phytophthora cinnamomi]|uniref:TKL/DRK protein kinase, variant n=1 Tax=Phytophthora cinnamomi TaxID=4785 RepID=UPI003559475F|nr:TKL/DRK protein kinase, variant [Phytophthora cinnamomi]KAG6599620.1 TKL/DRK protein kinase, variant [Phytophthora cinnamomi]
MEVPTLKVYENTVCSGKPTTLSFFPDEKCSDYNLDQCYYDGNHGYTVTCASSYKAFTDTIFGTTPYLFMELYADGTSCGTFKNALVYSIDGKCHAISDTDTGTKVTLNSDNSITFVQALDTTCTQMNTSTADTITSDKINTNVCVENGMKLYSNVGATSTTTSTTTTTASTSTGTSDATSYRIPEIATVLVALGAQVVFGF